MFIRNAHFCCWVDDLRKMGMSFTAATQWMSIGPTLTSYERYRRQRDWEEFAAAGKLPFTNPRDPYYSLFEKPALPLAG
jgi:hypothetical protein